MSDDNVSTEITPTELRGLLLLAAGWCRQAHRSGEAAHDALAALALVLELAEGELR